ncbi:DNA-processing protein DprA [Thioclava litoralis]|uniref:DNA-processing protein DprA n=1 Tax=Thioclava litoralis TaxID=3076557 RepID=A0ABZ1E067_9RHOB|nr:DNA-processing protein DprA [Thioclava sp. FTW29]
MKTGLFSYPTPFTPPTTEENELLVLRLFRSRRVGATTFHRIITEHGSATAALAALPEIARAAGVPDYSPCNEATALAEMKAGRKAGARLLVFGGPDYPQALLDLPDAPPVLWALGDTSLLQRPALAFVGARSASSLGRRMAAGLAQEAGEAGYVIVSGLARGIDAEAHQAALLTGTIGVQGGGIDVIYPKENAGLHDTLSRQGLRLSENPPGMQPQARHFPQRNRIISGLARATIVIEAAAKSGSLLTARNALDQGREVMAVPGHPMDGRVGGCNLLIRDGATLIRDFADIAEALGPAPPQPSHTPPLPQSAVPDDLAQALLELLGPSPVLEDHVIRDLQTDAATFAQLLTDLELEGMVLRHPGSRISLA